MGDMGFQDIQEFFHLGKLGFWKLEIEDGRLPRLYADAMMDELLGVEGPITPEQRHAYLGERCAQSHSGGGARQHRQNRLPTAYEPRHLYAH